MHGPRAVTYNVRSLVHLADVRLREPLNRFPAFPFGSLLGKLREDVFGPRNPTVQIQRLIAERSASASGDTLDCLPISLSASPLQSSV
ncbi:hypothetical protein CLF_113585 [Clonorchis sinensis]|uniref:Uncharacterized protein n=1 Tax=Clonorchis sinensis TaxID=79923 RepID=G7YYU0_CLOSI|nr:hypothetical protein CLF_113585 [Clonorchis sinensis]